MDLTELKRNSVDMGKNPVYILDFIDQVWCMIPKSHWEIMKDEFE